MKFFLNTPLITAYEKKYVNNAINSGWISVNGKYNKLFEKKFGLIIKKKNNITVQSGTSALHLALKALGAQKGTKIIIPNYSCSANISSVSQCSSTAIIVEVEKDTLGLDYELVKLAIDKYKPKILQLVHIYGFPARDTEKIVKLCKKKKIVIIEDASEALGAKINNRNIGSYGDISIFSLRSEKMIGVGEGAVISTNNNDYFSKIELLANRNMPYRTKKNPYWMKYISHGEGYNYLMPHVLGAFGYGQLKNLNKIIKKKIFIGKLYRKIFHEFNFTQKLIKSHKNVFWLNSIILKNFSVDKVRKIGCFIEKKGAEVRPGFWPLINTPLVKKFFVRNKYLKISDEIYKKSLVLPSNINLNVNDINNIKNIVKTAIKKFSK